MEKKKVVELSDSELESIAGGYYTASDELLKDLILDEVISYDSWASWAHEYYQTKRNDGSWKQVGVEDMLNYAGSIKGFNTEEYKALCAYVHDGICTYNGKTYESPVRLYARIYGPKS